MEPGQEEQEPQVVLLLSPVIIMTTSTFNHRVMKRLKLSQQIQFSPSGSKYDFCFSPPSPSLSLSVSRTVFHRRHHSVSQQKTVGEWENQGLPSHLLTVLKSF